MSPSPPDFRAATCGSSARILYWYIVFAASRPQTESVSNSQPAISAILPPALTGIPLKGCGSGAEGSTRETRALAKAGTRRPPRPSGREAQK